MMRQPVGDSGATVTRSRTLPAPVGGWNALDSIADMGPKDAVFLDNFFPRTTDVMLRKGCVNFALLPVAREIRTLMGYKSSVGALKLFAAANDGIYDITAGGAIGAAAIACTNNAWQYLNTTTPGGSFLVAVNGVDNSMLYDGSNWILHSPTGTAQTISSITNSGTLATLTTSTAHGLITGTKVTVAGTTPAAYSGTFIITVLNATQFTYTMLSNPGGNATAVGTYTIPFPLTGTITPTTAVNVSVFKNRVILCAVGSMSFWYLPVNQVAGAASEFPLTAVFRKGGYLMATDSWTLDGGNGPDDYFVAISSEGEVALYKGTDPGNATAFSLVGVFELSQPMGRRCIQKAGSETYILTKQAIYPLARSLATDNTDNRITLTRRIERAWNDATNISNMGNFFGWQMALFPEASMMLVNVPTVNYATRNIIYSNQYVMNLMTGAWCRFTNWNAETIISISGRLFYALHNAVFEAWVGNNDAGAAITGRGKTAFNPLGTSRPKQVSMVRPVITAGASLSMQLGVDMDFADNSLYSSTASYSQNLSKWDSAVWGQSTWNGSSTVLAKWRTVASKVGRYSSVRLQVSAKDVTMTWIAMDLAVQDSSEILG